MALIVLLLANATLTQVFTADGLRADPRNQRVLLDEYSRQRGQISAGGQLLAYSVSTDGRFRFLRVYPNPLAYAPVTGFYSLQLFEHRAWSAPRTPSSTAPTSGCSGGGWPTSSPAATRAAAMSRPPSIPRCSRRPGTRWRTAATGRARARWWRWSRRPARSWRWCRRRRTTRTCWPPTTFRHSPTAWQQLRDNPDSPLLNRAISETYPPGSTFKVITTAAALQAGATENTQLTAAPRIPLPDSTATLENYGGASCGAGPTASLRDAFAKSCNTAFVQLGIDTGADALRIDRAWRSASTALPRRFRFRSSESTVGPITDAAALGMSSIGQKDVALTPLQNALVAATIANEGVTMRPYLVDSLKGPDLANISTTAPREERRAVSEQVATTLTDLMVAAEQVTQQKGAIAGVQIASKTGTAEHGTDPRNTPPHAWYIAFAPAQAPKVAVAVLVENGGDRLSATGGALAAPIGRATIAAALREGS